ncbi:MAG: matrixin family metalloprotease [Phycisphaerales bacterium]|nr:matrixin family metalloprotease [Phycisphaerales bacterium]
MVHTVREAHDKIYVAISHNTVRSSLGAYEIDVDIVRGGPVPPPTNQTILLSFAGGHVEDPVFGTYDVSAFDAGDIAARYQDDTDLIKNVIKQVFAQNYERFSVEIWDTDDPQAATQLAGRVYSRIVFGGFNTYAFGAAEDVDLYNANTADTAIIFTESFQPGLFNGAPSSEQLGVAIGNVAAHEMGHLLGLHHVNDATALMDEASPAYTLLDDQEFKQAPLSHSIFPLGLQDSADLLAVIVGLNADAAKLTRDASPPSAEAWTRMAKNSQAQAFSDTDPVMSKCGTCLWREALAGRGPLKDLVSRD